MKRRVSRAAVVSSIIAAIFFAVLCYAYFIEPDRLLVNQTNLRIKNWNPVFDGIKIVMIADIHGGSNNVTVEKMRQIVAKSNEQDPDLVVLLGDYVSQYRGNHQALKMPMNTVADGMSGLRARYGVYAVLGNHDVLFNDGEVAAELTRVGYRVLQNEVAVIEKNGQRLRIFGLKDHIKIGRWIDFSDNAKKVLEENDQGGDVIVLEHSPDILPVITGDLSISPDLKLILAGHTHGGQVWFPVLGSLIVPSSYGQRYAYGHVYENNVDMFVTTGIGTSILPIRFMVPPEIAVLTIRSQ